LIKEITPGRPTLLSVDFDKLIPSSPTFLRFMEDGDGWEERRLANIKWSINHDPSRAKIFSNGRYHEGNFDDIVFAHCVHAVLDAQTGRLERTAEFTNSQVTLVGTAREVLKQIHSHRSSLKQTRRYMFKGIARSSFAPSKWRVLLG
jgi:hypothetical protein